MAGLLAWAADVVGGSGQSGVDGEIGVPVVFTTEQQAYAAELDAKASALKRSIQDLRLRIPPAHISQRLPDLHAHSVASSALLALQLNAHSTTREQAQLRERTLHEENTAYEKAISNCEKKIQEKRQEKTLLRSKLKVKEMDILDQNLKAELESALASKETSQQETSLAESTSSENFQLKGESLESFKIDDLEEKKKELASIEEAMQKLETEWLLVQQESFKKPTSAQREKLLEKQLHSLIEQLTSKQVQAEGLMAEIQDKEKELERVNLLRRNMESGNIDLNTTRNRFGKSFIGSGHPGEYSVDAHRRPHNTGRTETQQKLMLLRSAFVLYILVLHVVVFIKISS